VRIPASTSSLTSASLWASHSCRRFAAPSATGFFWWYTVVLLAFVLYFVYTDYMAKSISVHTKKRGRGRPATGHDPAVTTRLPVEVLVKVEKWAVDNECQRSQAIARLVQLGLAAAEKRGRGGAAK
jgi:hypothetical protein